MVADNHRYDVNGKSTQFANLKSLEQYRVKGDALQDGPSGQHALFLHQNGKLGMFDNQKDRNNISRYIEYEIKDDGNGNYTAQKTDEYSYNSLYAPSRSDVDFTEEGNILLCYTEEKTILEVNKTSKDILLKLNLPFMSYRVDKIPLYYDKGRKYSEDSNLKQPLVR